MLEAAIYVVMFVFYGAFWAYPADADAVGRMTYLTEHQTAAYCIMLIGYVVFGVVLSALVLALHERLKTAAPLAMRAASLFGLLWVGFVIAAGMIGNAALLATVKLATTDPERALTLWTTAAAVIEGVGGGNELVGGLWVALLSAVAWRFGGLSRALAGFGLFVGACGVLTIIPLDALTEVFGLSQIVWFSWLGISLLRRHGPIPGR